MTDARFLHEIAKSLRALQIRAVEAGSAKADALLAIATAAVHEMAVAAERPEQAQAQTVAEMMQRLTDRRR